MIYYSVYDSGGNKIADCGSETDAKWLAEVRKGTYRSNRLDWGRTIDMATIDDQYAHHFGEPKELPTSDIVVNMDGGVGGSWKVQTPALEENSQQPFN